MAIVKNFERAIAEKPIYPGSDIPHSRSSCERKLFGFTTAREAWFELRKKRRKDDVDRGTKVYQCRWCGMFHWGRDREA